MRALQGKRVLVTGADGFLGINLIKRLKKEKSQLIALVKPGASIGTLREYNIKPIFCDITSRDNLKEIILKTRPQIIYHLAAYINDRLSFNNLKKSFCINVIGTGNLLDSLNPEFVERFIFLSTAQVYGQGIFPFKENQNSDPITSYSITKDTAERICFLYFKQRKIPIVIIRASLIYGPHQKPQMFLPGLIVSAIKKKNFSMTKGEQLRDFIYIDDVVEFLIKASYCKNAIGEIFNLGSGRSISIKDITLRIFKFFKETPKINFGKLPYRENEIWNYILDISKAKKELNWRAATSLNEGLKNTIEYYRENYKRKTK